MTYKAEYIWIDGTEPTARLRSKTRVLADGAELPIWGFDGSSTNQAPGDQLRLRAPSRVLVPRPDPRWRRRPRHVRGPAHRHDPASHQHAGTAPGRRREVRREEPWFGIEQEYTFFKDGRPHGCPGRRLTPPRRASTTAASAPMRCTAVTSSRRTSKPAWRPVSACPASTPRSCPASGSSRSGPLGPLEVSDQMWLARWLLYRVAEEFDVVASRSTQAGEGRLERCRRPHQLLDERHARGLRRHHRRLRGARHEGPGARAGLRRRHRGSPHRRPRDRPVDRVLATACPTVAPRSASRGRSPRTRRATSRIGAPTPTSTPTS